MNSQVSAIAYDPVQSLLAVGTNETQFGQGQIYVYGKRRISVTFNFQRNTSAKFLAFCGTKLVCVDSKHDINVFSLETNSLLVSYASPNFVTAFATDPSIEYAFIGLQNGAWYCLCSSDNDGLIIDTKLLSLRRCGGLRPGP